MLKKTASIWSKKAQALWNVLLQFNILYIFKFSSQCHMILNKSLYYADLVLKKFLINIINIEKKYAV